MMTIFPGVQISPCNGYLAQCSLYVVAGSVGCPPITPPSTDVVEIDVLMNGVSIFGELPKMTWAGGTTEVQYFAGFVASPFAVQKGDLFSVILLTDFEWTDSGILGLELLVI